MVRARAQQYDVDVESDRRSPDAPPGRWGAPPPPPPPPPPPQAKPTGGFQAPSRREAMFGLLGAGLGVGLTTAYYKTQFDDSPEALADALDALLEDPEFLDAVADEVMYSEYENNMEVANEQLDQLRNQLLTEDIKKKGE